MKAVFEWLFEALNEARGEIIASIVLAGLVWLCNFSLKVYENMKKKFGCLDETKQEIEAKNVNESDRRNETDKQLEAQQHGKGKITGKKQSTSINDSEFMKLYREGDVEKIEEAIRNGANVDAKDDKCNTVLILAALEGKTQIVELLLRYGANINAKNIDGRTALGMARNAPIRKLLINTHDARK